jgi:hypothetical protein
MLRTQNVIPSSTYEHAIPTLDCNENIKLDRNRIFPSNAVLYGTAPAAP